MQLLFQPSWITEVLIIMKLIQYQCKHLEISVRLLLLMSCVRMSGCWYQTAVVYHKWAHHVCPVHSYEYVLEPSPVALPLVEPQQTRVLQVSCGRAHSLVLTDNEGGKTGAQLRSKRHAHSHLAKSKPNFLSFQHGQQCVRTVWKTDCWRWSVQVHF